MIFNKNISMVFVGRPRKGVSPAASSPGLPPAFVTAPVIIGTPTTGVVCSCTDSTYSGTEPVTKTYQWTINGSNIAGAVNSTYTPLVSDAGSVLRRQDTLQSIYGGPITSGGLSAGVTVVLASASAITSSVVASRTSGVAPLFVYFDATATTSSDTSITSAANGGAFRNITSAFNFGDSTAGTWTITGLSRNTHSGGPITGHLFETPGTYTVNVTHSHTGTGDKTATPITVTVTDPATVYSGTNTIVVGTLTPLPGLASASYVTSVTNLTNNKRYLFLRGGTYSINGGDWTGIRVDAVDSSGVIGSSGSGAKPIFNSQVWQLGTIGTYSDFCFSNLRLNNSYVQPYGGLHGVFARIDHVGTIGTDSQCTTSSDYFHQSKYTCWWEYNADATLGNCYGYIGAAPFTMWMGCDFFRATYHNWRIAHAYKTGVQHCRGKQPGSIYHQLKINGGGTSSGTVWNESAVSTNDHAWISQYVVVSNGIWGDSGSNNSWTIECAPQNNDSGGAIEGVSDVIFENNIFNHGSGTSNDVNAGGRRITTRGNVGGNVSTASLFFGQHANSGNIPPSMDGPYFTS